MITAKITIESGENKAIFNFEGEQCTIDFEPAIDTNKEELTEEEAFVHNVSGFIVAYLTGQDKNIS